MEYLIIDRIEGGYAVCEKEDRTAVKLPVAALPIGVREGDCLRKNEGGYLVDHEETARRRQAADALFHSLTQEK